jgi:GGDEF domain-containing protein
VDRSPEETFDFLARSYRLAKIVALGVVSVLGVLVSVAALDVQVSERWTSDRLPLWVFALVVVALLVLLGIPAVVMSLLLRDSMQTASYFRSKASHLEDAVRGLESLAYNDPITGIPNSNALRRELERSANHPRRCLILLDLKDFGAVNKRFDHWAGDEYLRRFSEMVSRSGRRNEFLFKLRPAKEADPSSVQEEAKTFRKNTGGDEFFVLLEGTVLDGLGYLRRLQLRKREFDEMSKDVLGDYHPFGFTAGVIAVAPRETYDQATRRVSQCLALTRPGASVYWNEGDIPEPIPNSLETTLRKQVVETFGDPRSSRRPGSA